MANTRPGIDSPEMEALFYAPFEAPEHAFVNGRPYIRKDAIRRRLSRIDPYWQITEPVVVKDDGKTVVLAGSLIVLGVQRFDIGTGSIATVDAKNNPLSPLEITRNTIRGFKTAASDILPRCAVQFGLGSYLKGVSRNVVDERTLADWLRTLKPVQPPPQQQPEQPTGPTLVQKPEPGGPVIVEGTLKDAFPDQVKGDEKVVPNKDWKVLHGHLKAFYKTPEEVKAAYSVAYLAGKITDGIGVKTLVNYLREVAQAAQSAGPQQQPLTGQPPSTVEQKADSPVVPPTAGFAADVNAWVKFREWSKPYLVRPADEVVTDDDLDTRLFKVLQTIPDTAALWSPSDFRGDKVSAMAAVVAFYSDYDLPAFRSQVRTNAALKKLENELIVWFNKLKKAA